MAAGCVAKIQHTFTSILCEFMHLLQMSIFTI